MCGCWKLIPFVTLVTLLILIVDGSAGSHQCSHCCRERQCSRVCRLIREDRKITKTCWGCECEDFCIPGPSCPGCEHCETICSDCVATSSSSKPGDVGTKLPSDGPGATVFSEPRRLVWKDWLPRCNATVHTKRKLMKKTITKTVPSWKWVVVDLCEECQPLCPDAPVEPDAVIPPRPTVIEPPKP